MSTELWAARLERSLTESERRKMLKILPSERRERLLRCKIQEKQQEPLCAWALLLYALQERKSWREFPPIAFYPDRKPFFPDYPELHFNLSHTNGAVLVALSDAFIGVDIERIRPLNRQILRRLPKNFTELDFFQSWVRREARFKRIGTGPGMLQAEEHPFQDGERFYHLDIFPGYAAGVSVCDGEIPNIIHKFVIA